MKDASRILCQYVTVTPDQMDKTICIVGAGPVGLAALKSVLDSPQYKAGHWKPSAFESRDDIGGVWYILELIILPTIQRKVQAPSAAHR